MYQVSWEEIFGALAVDREIKEAVVNREGPLGKLLSIAIIMERGQFDRIESIAEKLKIPLGSLAVVMADAFEWVAQQQD